MNFRLQTHHKRTTTKAAPFPLMDLPPELHLIIAGNLNPIDRISLKLTNRHLYQTIPPLRPQELALVQAQLYKHWGPDNQAIPGTSITNYKFPYLACMSCNSLRLSTKFTDEQTRWSPVLKVPPRLTKGILVSDYRLLQRFCIDCGIKERRGGYMQGDVVRVNQEEYVVCNFCNKLGKNGKVGSRRRAAGLCEDCWMTLEIFRGGWEENWMRIAKKD